MKAADGFCKVNSKQFLWAIKLGPLGLLLLTRLCLRGLMATPVLGSFECCFRLVTVLFCCGVVYALDVCGCS